MEIKQISSSIFRVVENDQGTFDVAFDLPSGDEVRFSLVSFDRHAADTMAYMFNRVVNGVSAD